MQSSCPKKINEIIDYPDTIMRNGNYQLKRAYDEAYDEAYDNVPRLWNLSFRNGCDQRQHSLK